MEHPVKIKFCISCKIFSKSQKHNCYRTITLTKVAFWRASFLANYTQQILKHKWDELADIIDMQPTVFWMSNEIKKCFSTLSMYDRQYWVLLKGFWEALQKDNYYQGEICGKQFSFVTSCSKRWFSQYYLNGILFSKYIKNLMIDRSNFTYNTTR